MFDPTYNQLKVPEYMKFQANEILILAEYTREGEYVIHRLYNKFGRHYSPIEIETMEKFENIKSLDELISFLTQDNEPCELNPLY